MRVIARAASLPLVAGMLAPSGALAGWPTDPGVNLAVCTAEKRQESSRIASDGQGGAIVAWLDTRTDQDHVYAQRIDAAGETEWAPDGVPVCEGSGVRGTLAIVGDGAGGAILSWHELRGGSFDIYAQRVGSDGTLAWPAAGVAVCTADGDQFLPSLAEDGFGGALLTWFDNRLVTSQLYAQRVDGAGAVLWELDGVKVCNAPGAQIPTDVHPDGTGGAFIAWQDGRKPDVSITQDYDVYAQRLDATGEIQWDLLGTPVCTSLGYQSFAGVVPDGEGGVILSWHDLRGDGYDIYTQRVSGAGSPQWTADGVALCTAADWQSFPTILADGAGGAIVTWQDFRTLAHYDIYVQRVDAGGVPQWTLDGVALCTADGWQTGPRIESDMDGGAIVAWTDYRADSSDVYLQRVSHDGSVLWEVDGAITCSAPRNQHAPVLVSNGARGAIVAWSDFRGGGTTDIYAQGVNADGSLGSFVGVEFEPPSGGPAMLAAFPNPAVGAVRLRFELERASAFELSIFDALGHRVAALASGTRGAGRHDVIWDGRDALGRPAASGVYFARVATAGRAFSRRIVTLD